MMHPALDAMEKAEDAALENCWNISQPSAINAHCWKAAALAFIDHYSDPANHEKFVEAVAKAIKTRIAATNQARAAIPAFLDALRKDVGQ